MAKNGGNQFASGPPERGKATAANRLWSTIGGFGSFREGWKWQELMGDCPGLGQVFFWGSQTGEVRVGRLKNRPPSFFPFRVEVLSPGLTPLRKTGAGISGPRFAFLGMDPAFTAGRAA
jgi:hypothetical protein